MAAMGANNALVSPLGAQNSMDKKSEVYAAPEKVDWYGGGATKEFFLTTPIRLSEKFA